MMLRTRVVFLILISLGLSCARAPIKSGESPLRVTSAPDLGDDLDLSSLLRGIDSTNEQLKKRYSVDYSFDFGDRKVSRDDYIRSLEALRSKIFELVGESDRSKLFSYVKENFLFYEVYGDKKWGDVFMTSYYEPVIQGSKHKTKEFSQALYRKPNDIIEVSIKDFDPKYGGRNFLTGRMGEGKTQRGYPFIVPYYSREDIDSKGVLRNRKLEIVWVDPIEAFFLQIQGSGTIVFPDQSFIRVGFKDGVLIQNGQPYVPVGKFMTDKIPIEEMSLSRMESYMRALSPDALQALLNKNPSYVFFEILDASAMTNFGIPAIDGRSIATDPAYFSKGLFGFLTFDKPVLDSPDQAPKKWEPTKRFIFDHDIGGAIKGPGRLDLFWGRGGEAKSFAGVMKNRGNLYFLAPK